MNFKYPVYRPYLVGNEKKYVNECLDSTWISSKGKFVAAFEKQFADYIGIDYATGVPNGTIALHLALVTLGINTGDEVIVPTFTYIASVNAIAYTGATPIFVDSLPDTWQMNPEEVKRKITQRTKAIMPVHLYGHPCDMDKLIRIADDNHIFLVEDCAESFGSRYNGRMTGTFGSISAFSFFGNKTITTGEGGMVITNDKTLYERAVHFKGQGLAEHREYWHDVIGFNYRMTNICAAIGLAQLERADEIVQKKRDIASFYIKYLKNLPVEYQKEEKNVFHSYWMFSIVVKESHDRESLREYLKTHGIETRPAFYPVHTMPMYSKPYQKFPVAENLAWHGINLPSYPELTEDDVEFICQKIGEYYA